MNDHAYRPHRSRSVLESPEIVLALILVIWTMAVLLTAVLAATPPMPVRIGPPGPFERDVPAAPVGLDL